MNANCEMRNCEKQSPCDKNEYITVLKCEESVQKECKAPPACNSVCSKPPECNPPPPCNSVCTKPPVCHKEQCQVQNQCHHHHHHHGKNGGGTVKEVIIIEDEGRYGRREPYYDSNYGCDRNGSGESGPVTRIIVSGNSGENSRVATCGNSMGRYNNGENNVKEVIIVGDKGGSCHKDKSEFQLIKEDFSTKTSATKSHRVYEKKLPNRKNTVEIVIEQDQPNQVMPQPVSNLVYAQPRVEYMGPPVCNTVYQQPQGTTYHHHHHHHYSPRRHRSYDHCYDDRDDRYYRYHVSRRQRPNGHIYVDIDDGAYRGYSRNGCGERRPISKIVLIREEENNRGTCCEHVHTTQKCCNAKPVKCKETQLQCCQCKQPCPNYNTCHCVPCKTEKKRHHCCHCLTRLFHRKKSQSCS